MIELTPAELAGIVGGRLFRPDGATIPDVVDGPVVADSRLAEPGSIFFALQGETTHGHEFAASAVASGAVLVVAEAELDLGVPIVVVDDSLAALSTLARSVVATVRSQGRLRVVAVTGSNGKTTTKNMLRTILERVGPVVAPRGSFNNHVGAPLSMLGVDRETRFLVVEMGASAPGELSRLVSIVVPDVAIVLKVGLAHAGGFGSIEETAKAKAELVTELPADAVAVLNADDTRVAAMAGSTRARVVTFGLSESADVRAEDVATTVRGTEFTLVAGRTRTTATLRILGEHNVMNALAALAAVREFGVGLDEAIGALEELARAERWRMELLAAPDGVTVINDAYNASPDSMAAALKTLAEVTRGTNRAIAVLGEMAELGEYSDEEHDRIGRLVVRLNIDRLVVVGRGARHIHNAAGLEGSWNGESVLVADADGAYDLLRGELRSGDVVLVKSSNSAGLRLLGDRIAGVS
ncbi:MAG TPA: UDP-N-acetylmuramoyl-tripeptide--D-alanyl-D-alanine ligase [Terrimesophilobacter sp.]|nr:UDP-N-acetylmuramoyl-tripeptide--D-alanyl-D-alanine ligase [Terrimesophilobacter sp.]